MAAVDLLDDYGVMIHRDTDTVFDDVHLDVVFSSMRRGLRLSKPAPIRDDLPSNGVGADGLLAGVANLPVHLEGRRNRVLCKAKIDPSLATDHIASTWQIVVAEAWLAPQAPN